MSLRSFCLRIFKHCPLLAPFSVENHMRAFEEFLQYKTRVPVRGAILLNEAMDSTVLVKGWKKGANWSFPRGKINKDEDDLDCAIREVYEETGLDLREAGLVPKDDEIKYIQISMREQQIRLYVFRNVPMDTVFQPKTRKEISKVQWYKLSELPAFRKKGKHQDDAAAASNANKFYMVAPFLVPLKKWVVQQKKKDAARAAASNPQLAAHAPAVEEAFTEDDIGAQTEPVAAAETGAPAIETLEGATQELQRLLQVQPPTQGLHVNAPAASNPGKGEALMALLQKRDAEAPPQQAPQPEAQGPHASFDLPRSDAPEPPNTRHHQHLPYPLPVPNHEPAPSFPIPSSTALDYSGGHYQESRASTQVFPQIYGRNPFTNPTQQQPQKEPVLVHPQPLPPQVQQSLLTRGILSTPNLPDTPSQGGAQAQQDVQNPFMARSDHTYGTQVQAPKPTQLTSHAMALLNTFKNGSREDNENRPGGHPSQGSAVLQGDDPSRSVPWAGLPNSLPPNNPVLQYLPHHMAPVAPTRTSPHTAQPSDAPIPAVSRPLPPTDAHRSALLDMFKRSGPRSPLSNEIRSHLGPEGTPEEAGFSRSDKPSSPAHRTPSAAEAIASASDINGGPVQMNPEVALPYRPVQILSRPKQAEPVNTQDLFNTQAQIQRLQQRLSPHGSTWNDGKSATRHGVPSPRDRALAHQVEQESKRFPQYNYAAQAASLPYTQTLHQPPSGGQVLPLYQQQQQPASVFQRRPDTNSEQKQKLLSLFGKEPPSAPGFAGDDKGKAREPAAFDLAQAAAPRSTVASFASAGGADVTAATGSAPTSRRGSQTPISPADRNFLLSYLESVSNSAR